jgi:hypothetical protein
MEPLASMPVAMFQIRAVRYRLTPTIQGTYRIHQRATSAKQVTQARQPTKVISWALSWTRSLPRASNMA